MGADFLLYPLPWCKLTKKRVRVLKKIAKNEDIKDFPCEYGDNTELHSRLNAAIDFLDTDASDSRETKIFTAPNNSIDMLYTGGMSWGDWPTECSTHFDILGQSAIWDQLLAWAIEDKDKTKQPQTKDEHKIQNKFNWNVKLAILSIKPHQIVGNYQIVVRNVRAINKHIACQKARQIQLSIMKHLYVDGTVVDLDAKQIF